MSLARGFVSEAHAAAFAEGRELNNRGGADRKVCGARTRSGGACQQPPLKGHLRCLRHAGAKAAREFRERQLQDLAAGRLSLEEFEKRERRRLANKLHTAWKRDPWLPGSTLDLGEHEAAFRAQTGLARYDGAVPPAVLDWLRWRYRRLQIDRRRDEEWARVVREDYPRRVREAGRPVSYDTESAASAAEQPAPLWRIERAVQSSKRQRLDIPRTTLEQRPRKLRASMLPVRQNETALAAVVARHSETLAPLLSKCIDEAEERALIVRLYNYLTDPSNYEAGARWREAVNELRSRD